MPEIEHIIVSEEENGMRLDRWFRFHYPDLFFVLLQKLLRKGQIRIDGRRGKADSRVSFGQTIRIPSIITRAKKTVSVFLPSPSNDKNSQMLAKMLLYEDEHLFVFNKLSGLAVQGGSGISVHMDDMLQAWRNKKNERPRLVHRLDRETSGVFIVARTRLSANRISESFRTRQVRKIYWSLVHGVPDKQEGKISTWLVKEKTPDGDRVKLARHGDRGAEHAVSFYRIVERASRHASWLQMEPYTGRTHQLRVHAVHIGTPVWGDSKYANRDGLETLGGIQNRLHLHARRIILPHPDKGFIDVTAPLPAHMQQSWNLLGFEEANAEDRGTDVI